MLEIAVPLHAEEFKNKEISIFKQEEEEEELRIYLHRMAPVVAALQRQLNVAKYILRDAKRCFAATIFQPQETKIEENFKTRNK